MSDTERTMSDTEKTGAPVIEVVTGILMILDIIDRIEERTGVTIRPEDLATFVAQRTAYRRQLNEQLGIQLKAGGQLKPAVQYPGQFSMAPK